MSASKPSRRIALAGIAAASLAPVTANATTSPALERLIAEHAEALAVFNAAIDATEEVENQARCKAELRAVWQSAAYKAAYEAQAAACQKEEEAGLAIVAYPCASMADVVRKASYMVPIPTMMEGNNFWFDALVRSLLPVRA